MNMLSFAAWVLLHVAVPLLMPLALLPLLSVTQTFRRHARAVVRKAFNDGQLYWSVMAMSAGSCYELASYLNNPTPSGRPWAWGAMLLQVFALMTAAALILVGTLDALHVQAISRHATLTLITRISIVMTGLVVLVYTAAHWFIVFA